MPRKFAVRRIQHSETTFFQPLLERIQAAARLLKKSGSKQKALNLDRSIFIDQLYPALEKKSTASFPIYVDMYGPDDARGQRTVQLIKKTAKNWRLEGATVRNPPSDPKRYDNVLVGDFLFFEFLDTPDGTPETVNIQIVSRTLAVRTGLEADFDALLPPGGNMAAITEAEMAALCTRAAALPANPLAVFDAAAELLLEDALTGDAVAVERVRKRGRNISREELLRTQQTRDLNGDLGEALVAVYLAEEKTAGSITGYVHDSQLNAVQPHDFTLTTPAGSSYIDVKSTSGRHESEFHISAAELAFAATSSSPYLIYRVAGLTGTSGVLRISSDIRPLAVKELEVLTGLKLGFRATSFAVGADLLEWGDPIPLQLPVQPLEA